MKKYFPLFLVGLLFISIVAGCNNNETASSGEPHPNAGKENEFGWTVPKYTLEFSYYAGQLNPKDVEKNTKLLNEFLLEQFNVKINKKVTETDPKERLNLMLASNDYPEVITGLSPAEVEKWKNQKRAIDLTEYIDKYAPTIKEKLGDTYKRYLDKDGKLYGLPNYWGYLPIPDYSANIPYTKWVEIGKPKTISTEEYFDLLKEMQANTPVNQNGQKTYALSGENWKNGYIYKVLAGAWGLKDGFKEDENGNLTHWINTPEGIELTKYLNKFQVEGLLDPNSFINDFDQWKEMFSNKRVFGSIGPWWHSWNAGHEVWQKTDKNWKPDDHYVQIGLKAPGVDQAYLSPKNTIGSSRTIITDKAKDPEKIIKFLNFAFSDMGNKLLGWGVPNEEISIWGNKSGEWTWVEERKNELINGKYDYDKGFLTGQGEYAIVAYQGMMEDETNWWYDQNFNNEAEWKRDLNENLKDTIFDNTLKAISVPLNDPLAVKEEQINTLINTGISKAVQANSPEMAEKIFIDLREKVNKAGLNEIEEYKTKVYKERLKNWK
ncbi:type 2 periplasmic-binding domain-containing protein [Viridibacillus arvi]|uniref:sugar ABC transporter substrate-binding protein n=1 Tax=Viridibacillus arvi TaxID=263475 RepID=UPI0036F0A72F